MTTQRNHKIELLRVIAILSVVLGHSCIIYTDNWNYYSTPFSSDFFKTLKEVINSYQMQLFFAISGALFYKSSATLSSFQQFVTKKIHRLIVPFLFIFTFWLVPVRYFADYPLYDHSIIKGYLSFFNNDLGHLWFLPTLFIIFIIAFFLRKVIKSQIACCIVLVSSFIISYVFKKQDFCFYLKSPCIWFVYFWLGYSLFYAKWDGKILENTKSIFRTFFFTFMILFSVGIRIYFMEENGLLSVFSNLASSLIITLTFFLLLPTEWENSFVKYLDKNSMGIYLFHAPIIYFCLHVFNDCTPPLLVSLNFIISIVISLAMTKLIRLARLNFILGE